MINKNYSQLTESQPAFYTDNAPDSIQSKSIPNDQIQYINSGIIGSPIVIGAPIQGFDEYGYPIYFQQVFPPQNYSNFQNPNSEFIPQQFQIQNNQVHPVQYVPNQQHIEENQQQNYNQMMNPIVIGQVVPINEEIRMFGNIYQPEAQLLRITSRKPQIAHCCRCRANVQSRVVYQIGLGTIISGGLVALTGGSAGCCLIPCCIKDFKNAVHFCTVCGQELGTKNFLIK